MRVGPKGYTHGWKHVGPTKAPDLGLPQTDHGNGTVSYKVTGLEGYGTNDLKKMHGTKTGEYKDGGVPQASKDKAASELTRRGYVQNAKGTWVKPTVAAKRDEDEIETLDDDVRAELDLVIGRELRYDVSPLGNGNNWLKKVGGLPLFIRAIAHALIRNGHSESSAIAIAVGQVKNWASGKGKVSAKTRAKAVAAVAAWESKKAASHA